MNFQLKINGYGNFTETRRMRLNRTAALLQDLGHSRNLDLDLALQDVFAQSEGLYWGLGENRCRSSHLPSSVGPTASPWPSK